MTDTPDLEEVTDDDRMSRPNQEVVREPDVDPDPPDVDEPDATPDPDPPVEPEPVVEPPDDGDDGS